MSKLIQKIVQGFSGFCPWLNSVCDQVDLRLAFANPLEIFDVLEKPFCRILVKDRGLYRGQHSLGLCDQRLGPRALQRARCVDNQPIQLLRIVAYIGGLGPVDAANLRDCIGSAREPAQRRALPVSIAQCHSQSAARERCRQINRDHRLADTTFLVRHQYRSHGPSSVLCVYIIRLHVRGNWKFAFFGRDIADVSRY